jgi:nicotinamide-nucleotide amidase
MRTAILSIGDELIGGETLDTHARWLSRELASRGLTPLEHRTVGDDRTLIARAIAELAARNDVLVITGGLGPTDDDLTRFALGDVVDPGEALVMDREVAARLERWFAGRARPMPEGNLAQARRPRPARWIPNPRGTAHGLAVEHDGCRIFVLPGPPAEMHPMFLEHVAAELPLVEGGAVTLLETVHCFGLGESDAADRLGDLTQRDRHPQVGITVSEGIVTARIRATGVAATAAAEIADTRSLVEQAWVPYAYGSGGVSLAEVVGELLRKHGVTLATAESCTGGLLGKVLVDVAGSSEYYRGGWISYANEMKECCLGVAGSLIETHGAVSEAVAIAMARGVLAKSSADHALAITGVAGPDGGTSSKPVGTVFIAHAGGSAGQDDVSVRRFRIRGDRGAVRDRSAKAALQMLRFAILGVPGDEPMIWEVGRSESAAVRTGDAST